MPFQRMYVQYGVWHGAAWPVQASMNVELAPPDDRRVAIRFHPMVAGAGAVSVLADDVYSCDADSEGWTFFGFGASGIAAAGIAGALDRLLAPWSLTVRGRHGQFCLRADHGPPPGAALWGELQNRLLAPATGLSYQERLQALANSLKQSNYDDADHARFDGDGTGAPELAIYVTKKMARAAVELATAEWCQRTAESPEQADRRRAERRYHGHEQVELDVEQGRLGQAPITKDAEVALTMLIVTVNVYLQWFAQDDAPSFEPKEKLRELHRPVKKWADEWHECYPALVQAFKDHEDDPYEETRPYSYVQLLAYVTDRAGRKLGLLP